MNLCRSNQRPVSSSGEQTSKIQQAACSAESWLGSTSVAARQENRSHKSKLKKPHRHLTMAVHSLHIFDRRGKTLFTKRYSKAKLRPEEDDEFLSEQRKLVFE